MNLFTLEQASHQPNTNKHGHLQWGTLRAVTHTVETLRAKGNHSRFSLSLSYRQSSIFSRVYTRVCVSRAADWHMGSRDRISELSETSEVKDSRIAVGMSTPGQGTQYRRVTTGLKGISEKSEWPPPFSLSTRHARSWVITNRHFKTSLNVVWVATVNTLLRFRFYSLLHRFNYIIGKDGLHPSHIQN